MLDTKFVFITDHRMASLDLKIFLLQAQPTRWQSWTESASTNYSRNGLAAVPSFGSRFEACCAVLMAGAAPRATPRHFQTGSVASKLAAQVMQNHAPLL